MNFIKLSENRCSILKSEKLANAYKILIDYNCVNVIDFKGIEKTTYVFMDCFLGTIITYKGFDWFQKNIITQNMSDGIKAIFDDIVSYRNNMKIIKL